MIVLRRKSKFFSNNNPSQVPPGQVPPTDPKQLTIENMRLQRMIMQNQRMKQKMEADERNARLRSLAKIQQAEAKKDATEMNNQVKIQKMEQQDRNPADRKWGLLKSSAKPTPPVPMK